jgi:hypothetical protein
MTTASDSIIWDFDQESQKGANNSSTSAIIRDAREMLRNPQRLRAVQHIALRGVPQIKHLRDGFFANNLAPDETEILKKWMSESRIPETKPEGHPSDAAASPSAETAAGVIITLLSRLQNIKTLEIQTFDRTAEDEDAQRHPAGDLFTARLLQHLASPSPSPNPRGAQQLRLIESATISVPRPEDDPEDEMDYYVYPSSVLPLFSLPRIRRIEAHRVDDGGETTIPAVIAPCHSLRELVLVRCQLTPGSLAALLRASPDLTSLRCDLVLDAEHAPAPAQAPAGIGSTTTTWYDLDEVRASLGPLQGSLEDLSLALNLWSSSGIDCGNDLSGVRPGIRGSLGPGLLRGFGRLARLSASLPVLLGWHVRGSPGLADVLPAGLRSLTVTNEMFFWWRYEWDGVVDWDDDETGQYGNNDHNNNPRWRWIEDKIVEYLESRPASLEELVLEISACGEAERVAQLRDTLVSKGQDVGVKVAIRVKS